MEDLFNNNVLICAGSGGVGKTTISAALAVTAAQRGLKVLVLTIDPAKRLSTSLGLDSKSDEVEVTSLQAKGQLFASLIDSKKEFDLFIEENSPHSELVNRIKKNKLYEQLTTTLSGSQEFTSLLKLYKCVHSKKYDLVILDTPPAQHAVDFLTAPEKINDLFQGKITKWFVGGDGSWWSQLFNKSTFTVLTVLKKLTGSVFMEELSDFFVSLKEIESQISIHSQAAHRLLKDLKTSFLIVTSFDQSKILEAEEFYAQLTKENYNIQHIIVNRAYPKWVQKELIEAKKDTSKIAYNSLYFQIKEYYAHKSQVYSNLEKDYQKKVKIVKIPEFDHDIYGLDGLVQIAEEFQMSYTCRV